MKTMCKLIILQSPFRCNEQFWRTLTDETFKNEVGSEKANVICNEFDILFNRIEMEWFFRRTSLQDECRG